MPSAEVEVAVMFDGPGSLLVYEWEEERWLHPFVIDVLDAVYQVFSHLCLQTRGRTSWRGGEVAARIRGNQRFMQDPERPSIVSSIQSTPPELLSSPALNVIPPTLQTKAPARSLSLTRLVPPA